MLRRLRWSIGLLPALVLVVAAGSGREAMGQTIYGLNVNDSIGSFSPSHDANGDFATVTGSVDYVPNSTSPLNSLLGTTTVDFGISGILQGQWITEFGFNSSVSISSITVSNLVINRGSSLTFSDTGKGSDKLGKGNVGSAGTFDYALSFQSNQSQPVTVEFTVSGKHILNEFVKSNDNDYFGVHLKSGTSTDEALGAGTGYVSGGTPVLPGTGPNGTPPGTVPEPPSIVMTSMAGLLGLGYRWRERRRQARAV